MVIVFVTIFSTRFLPFGDIAPFFPILLHTSFCCKCFMTSPAWVRTWYEVYAEPRIRPNTREYYTNYIENHIVHSIGEIMLDKLTTIQIQRFYNDLQKNGRVQRKGFPELKDKSLSPRVVRGVHTLLSNCLDQAVAERLILVNPAQGCKLPKM